MTKPVVLFGTGDFARVAHVYLSNDSDREVAAFTVHREYLKEDRLLDTPVVPFEDITQSHPPSEYDMFVAIGFSRVNARRRQTYEECKALGYDLITYVSSQAHHLGDLDIGDNCFVFEDNVIQPFVRIGNNVVLWSGNHIGHDAVIEDHCFLASHVVVSGNVTIGEASFVGVNATFRDGITVGPANVIGAGALIMADTKPEAVYVPEPTTVYKRKSSELRGF
jgi:sugar O-acyltransferase (sialic acid O-acetyltransferase NeuD family)